MQLGIYLPADLCVCCSQVGILITFLLLLIFSYSVVFLFVGTASLGLFLSSTFPSMLAYTEDILQYKGERGGGLRLELGSHPT